MPLLDNRAENDSESKENQGDDFQLYRQIQVYNKSRFELWNSWAPPNFSKKLTF